MRRATYPALTWPVLSAAALLALSLAMSPAAARAGEVMQIRISDLAFAPAEITVRVGDTVEWVNEDFLDHTATAQDGAFDVLIPAGKAARLTPTAAGTFAYFCRFHPDMTATLRVTAR